MPKSRNLVTSSKKQPKGLLLFTLLKRYMEIEVANIQKHNIVDTHTEYLKVENTALSLHYKQCDMYSLWFAKHKIQKIRNSCVLFHSLSCNYAASLRFLCECYNTKKMDTILV